jgi:hypothetical protein
MSTDPVLVQSHIVGATVFSELAHVTRRASAPLVPGLNRLAFEALPRHLDPARIRVRTTRGVVRFVEGDDLAWSADPADTPEDDAVADAARKVHRLDGELLALRAELELIDRLTPGRGLEEARLSGPLKPEVFGAGLDLVTQRRRETLYATRVAAYEFHLAQEALRSLEARREAGGRRAGPARRAVVVVGVDADAPGEAELSLTYDAAWATWRPYYALRLDGAGRHVEVARFADVWQQTGEDWASVALRLSSAEPEEGLELPKVAPWIMERRQQIQGDPTQLYKQARLRRPAPAPAAKPAALGRSGAPPARSMAPPASMAPKLARRAMDVSRAEGGGAPAEDAATGDLLYESNLPEEVMADYAEQYEEEGDFASVSSAGLMAVSMSKEAYREDEGTDPGYAGGPPAPPMAPPPPPGAPPPPRRRHPPLDHPDFQRLVDLPAPRDSAGGIDFEQAVPGATELPSGSGHRRVGLTARRYAAQVQYLLRPAAKDHAFGRVEVVNAEDEPMLTGPAALFVDGAFFGATRIETTPAQGKLVLDLGAQTAIKSARRAKTTVRTEGLINKEDVHAVQVNIEVESFLDAPAALEIQDQIPVSMDERVKVKLLLPKAADAELDPRNGILTFRRTLAPRARLELTISYELYAPKDYRIHQLLTETTS